MALLHDILGPVLRAGLNQVGRRRLPQIAGQLSLPGLSDQVEIIRDRWGVPHIYAGNNHDLFLAQGFVHAQDRLWQMELNRRTAAGRLSELFGEVALDTDRACRTFGFYRLGQADWQNAAEDMRAAILAYTEGVNAFLQHPASKMPVEFALLRHRPQPWQPEDCLAFSRVMIWQLSHAWYGEITRAQLIEKVGAERAAELDLHYPDSNPVSLPTGIEFNAISPDGSLQGARGPFLRRGQGSNAWAISGRRTDSGRPYLCNDMHLAISIPSVWYEVHLVGGDFQVAGVSLPGLPMVLVGHNAHVAWGMTLAFTDCEDLFVESFDPQNPHRYPFQGQWLEAEVIPEVIPVKGRPQPHVENVIITRHGPVISDVISQPAQRLAVNSMALRPGPAARGWLRLNQAAGWDDFVAAMQLIEAPQLNVAYADVEGNIGYWVTGRTPIRAKGQGTIPAPGATGEYEWVGEIPFAEMPHTLNPERGYVVTCNHKIIADDYTHYLGNAWMNGYRARRLEELFAAKERWSAADCQAAQQDVTCVPGREFVQQLAGFSSQDPDVQLALVKLRAWDGRLIPDSVGGSLYEVTKATMTRNLLEPALGAELTTRWMGQGFHPLLMPAYEFYGYDTVTLLRLLGQPESWWIVQAGGRQALIERSLKQSVLWLREKLGADVKTWQWGRLHQVTYGHALGLQKPLDQVFNRGPFPIGGDTDTPCQTATLPNEPYAANSYCPSFRQIIDVGEFGRSVAVYPPGQSGHLASPHYDDLGALWLQGEYHPMLWTREEVEGAAEGTLTVRPG
ncbi:MAG: penicillin acylase family protein [Chloroflexota bacterium]